MKTRQEKAPRHVRLYHSVLESDAWRSLNPPARALYLELEARYNGFNNGRVALGVRSAGEAVHVSQQTAMRAFEELQDRGLIVKTSQGKYRQGARFASEWRLTAHSYLSGAAPATATKDFTLWTGEGSIWKPDRVHRAEAAAKRADVLLAANGGPQRLGMVVADIINGAGQNLKQVPPRKQMRSSGGTVRSSGGTHPPKKPPTAPEVER